MEKGCNTCEYFDVMEGQCTLNIANKIESRDYVTSECT